MEQMIAAEQRLSAALSRLDQAAAQALLQKKAQSEENPALIEQMLRLQQQVQALESENRELREKQRQSLARIDTLIGKVSSIIEE